MRKIILLLPLILLLACSDNSSNLAQKIKSLCWASENFECYNLKIDFLIAGSEELIEKLNDEDDKVIGCIGEEKYEELISMIDDSISYYDNQRYGFFNKPSGLQQEVLAFEVDTYPNTHKIKKGIESFKNCK